MEISQQLLEDDFVSDANSSFLVSSISSRQVKFLDYLNGEMHAIDEDVFGGSLLSVFDLFLTWQDVYADAITLSFKEYDLRDFAQMAIRARAHYILYRVQYEANFELVQALSLILSTNNSAVTTDANYNDYDGANSIIISQKKLMVKSFRKEIDEIMTRLERTLYPWLSPKYKTAYMLQKFLLKGSTGIVITVGQKYFYVAMHLVLSLRTIFNVTLPIEIHYAGAHDLSLARVAALCAIPGVTAINTLEFFPPETAQATGFAHKAWALLATRFETVFFMDADIAFLSDPISTVARSPRFRKNGQLFFHDRKLFYLASFPGIKLVKDMNPQFSRRGAKGLFVRSDSVKGTTNEMESGFMVFDKGNTGVFFSLLLTAKMNSKLEREKVLYRKVHGDKESFWMASETLRVPYDFVPDYAGYLGVQEENYKNNDTFSKICEGKLLHLDEFKNPFWFHGGSVLNGFYRDAEPPEYFGFSKMVEMIFQYDYKDDTDAWDGGIGCITQERNQSAKVNDKLAGILEEEKQIFKNFVKIKSVRKVKSMPSTNTRPSPWLVIPALFAHTLGSTLGATPLAQFLILKTCEELGSPGSGPGSEPEFRNGSIIAFPDYKSCAARTDVQTEAALWAQMITLATAIPAFCLVPLMGKLVDRVGRKTLMFVPITATMLGALSIIIVAHYSIGLWFIVAIHAVQGLMGGASVLALCAYAFIGDTTTAGKRTQTFLVIDAFSYFAFTIGPFSGGLLYRNFGILPVFAFVLALESFVLLYVIFFMTESLNTDQSAASAQFTPRTLYHLLISSWSGSLDILNAPGRGSSLFILAIVTAIGSMTFAGYQFIFFFYPSKRFGWDSFDTGLFSLTNSICRMFYLAILLPYLLRKLTEGKDTISKTRIELGLVRLGVLAFSLGMCCFGLAQKGSMFFGIVILYAFGTIAMPTIRGVVSRTVPSESQGSLFAALEVLQSGSTLVAQFVLPAIFRATVAVGYPQAICFVLSSLWAFALVLTAFLKSRELGEMEDSEIIVATERTPMLGANNSRRGSIASGGNNTASLRRLAKVRKSHGNSAGTGVVGTGDDAGVSGPLSPLRDFYGDESEEELSEGEGSTAMTHFQRRLALVVDPDFLDDVIENSAQEYQM
ncbi:hypothetical protein HK100_012065 [Physocladia obscura]|uniref:Major facilitator superfamily (MFS) profile domain-containing protein n=1 Tax=Physocladia obscura TaxID=109957 RepID=A0AAD5T388_9FUNG|nr:hypothetical protein HK100_012065 [Physocladia obscura]